MSMVSFHDYGLLPVLLKHFFHHFPGVLNQTPEFVFTPYIVVNVLGSTIYTIQ